MGLLYYWSPFLQISESDLLCDRTVCNLTLGTSRTKCFSAERNYPLSASSSSFTTEVDACLCTVALLPLKLLQLFMACYSKSTALVAVLFHFVLAVPPCAPLSVPVPSPPLFPPLHSYQCLKRPGRVCADSPAIGHISVPPKPPHGSLGLPEQKTELGLTQTCFFFFSCPKSVSEFGNSNESHVVLEQERLEGEITSDSHVLPWEGWGGRARECKATLDAFWEL